MQVELERPRSGCARPSRSPAGCRPFGITERYPRRPMTAGSRPTVRYTEEADSDFSDEEADELRRFWLSLRASGSLVSSKAPLCTAIKDGGTEGMKVSVQRCSVAPTCDEVQKRVQTPRPSGFGHRGVTCGEQLWRAPPNVMFEILCFLLSSCVGQLSSTCSEVRAGCSVHDQGWRLVVPHLTLSPATCEAAVRCGWLPLAMCLEALDLDATACRTLLTALGNDRTRVPARALTRLTFRNTRLCGVTVGGIARACQRLRVLTLTRTSLPDEGVRAVLNRLFLDPVTCLPNPHGCLQVLALENNGLTEAVGPALCQAILALPLEVLVLAKNRLGDAGVGALSKALHGHELSPHAPTPSGLVRLDVSENEVTVTGFAVLLQSLRRNRALEMLDLGGNRGIGAAVRDAPLPIQVTTGLTAAACLRSLHLWRCDLVDTHLMQLITVRAPALRMLNFAANLVSTELGELLHSRNDVCL